MPVGCICTSITTTRTVSIAGTIVDRKGLELPRGAYSRIARRMRPTVSPQAVRQVWLGKSKSARISAAITRYLKEQLLEQVA